MVKSILLRTPFLICFPSVLCSRTPSSHRPRIFLPRALSSTKGVALVNTSSNNLINATIVVHNVDPSPSYILNHNINKVDDIMIADPLCGQNAETVTNGVIQLVYSDKDKNITILKDGEFVALEHNPLSSSNFKVAERKDSEIWEDDGRFMEDDEPHLHNIVFVLANLDVSDDFCVDADGLSLCFSPASWGLSDFVGLQSLCGCSVYWFCAIPSLSGLQFMDIFRWFLGYPCLNGLYNLDFWLGPCIILTLIYVLSVRPLVAAAGLLLVGLSGM
ncbi:hypothetical protein MA16_Dca000548 [Dendrobium catenatum]|uniref:Uncharacterized protein n=1 Tax=Dendrobium catenatum TaxID=906689 RepID=A0A2I0WU60_9ASPA|nr:hypothetical protein MA16_Dca000548 [Dendrobium catenatum]